MEFEILITVLLISFTFAISVYFKRKRTTKLSQSETIRNNLVDNKQNNENNLHTELAENNSSPMSTPNNKKNKRHRKKNPNNTQNVEPIIIKESVEEVSSHPVVSNDHGEYKRKILDYENKMDSLRVELDIMTDKSTKLESEIKTKNTNIAQLIEKIDNLQLQIFDDSKYQDDTKQKLTLNDTIITKMTQELKRFEENSRLKTIEIIELKKTIEQLEKEIKSLKNQTLEINQKEVDNQNILIKDLNQYKVDLKTLESTNNQLKSKIIELNNEIETLLQHNNTLLTEQIQFENSFNATIKALEMENKKLELINKDLKTKTNDYELKINNLNLLNNKLSDENKLIELSYNDTKVELNLLLNSLSKKCEQLQLINNKLNDDNNLLKEQINIKNNNITTDNNNQEIEQLKKHSDIMAEEIIKMQRRAYSAENKVKELTDQLSSRSNESVTDDKSEALEKELQVSRTEYANLHKNYIALNKKIDDLIAENSQMDSILKATNSKLNESNNELKNLEQLKKEKAALEDKLKKASSQPLKPDNNKEKDAKINELNHQIKELNIDINQYRKALEKTEQHLKVIQESVDTEEIKWKQNLLESELCTHQLEDRIKVVENENTTLKNMNDSLRAKLDDAESLIKSNGYQNGITITKTINDNDDNISSLTTTTVTMDNNTQEQHQQAENNGDVENAKKRRRRNKKKNKKKKSQAMIQQLHEQNPCTN